VEIDKAHEEIESRFEPLEQAMQRIRVWEIHAAKTGVAG
jgi:hypothetical protein